MIEIYFSGTGNTKYCLELFVNEMDPNAHSFSIKDNKVIDEICKHDLIILAYLIYYSNLPKTMRDFIVNNHHRRFTLEQNKQLIEATTSKIKDAAQKNRLE